MIGILLITHTPVGTALLQAAKHVYGSVPEQCEAIDVEADELLQKVQDSACERIAALDTGEGVLVLSDLYGASPCNCASTLSSPGKVEVISGVSLPLLLRALNYRHLPLPVLSERIINTASQAVVRIAGSTAENQTPIDPVQDTVARFAQKQP